MTHTYTKKGTTLYRYYVCNNAQQHVRASCPAPSVPAGEIEAFVVEEIKTIGRDPALVAATLAESRRLVQSGVKRLKAERAALERQRRADDAELGRVAAGGTRNGDLGPPIEVQERVGQSDRRLSEIEDELARLLATDITEKEVISALGEFDMVWTGLTPNEQARVLSLLIERIDHDGKTGNLQFTFHAIGLKAMASQAANHEETAA